THLRSQLDRAPPGAPEPDGDARVTTTPKPAAPRHSSMPTSRLDQYRPYPPDLRPHPLVLPRETVSAPTLPLMRRLVARRRPHPAATVVDLGDGAGVRVFGDPDDPAPGPVLLWIHGGGYVFGSATQDDRWCHRIAARTGVLV